MYVLWLALTAHSACPERVEAKAVAEWADSAVTAFGADQIADGRERVHKAEEMLACVREPLTAEQAARMHQAMSLTAHHAGDRRGAVATMAAALSLDSALPGEGVEKRYSRLVEAARLQPAAAVSSFSTSLAAIVHVDGHPTASRRMGRPFVVQVFGAGGELVGSAWVAPGEPVPTWVASPPVACSETMPVDDLIQQVFQAKEAYSNLDVGGFQQGLQAVAEGLPCASGVVVQSQAAAIHRLEGLRQFVSGDESQAIRSFQEAHSLDPAYVPDESIVPPGSTLEALWEKARNQPGSPWVDAPVPKGLVLRVDGLPASARPAALPAIVQVSSESGWVLWTRFVPPGGSLPDFEPLVAEAEAVELKLRPPALAVYLQAEERRRRWNRRAGLVGSAVGALSASATLYLVNSSLIGDYQDPMLQYDRRPVVRRNANAAALGGTVALIGGVGLGVGAAFVR